LVRWQWTGGGEPPIGWDGGPASASASALSSAEAVGFFGDGASEGGLLECVNGAVQLNEHKKAE